jgi:thiol-disulfide isomerase/thioredoxin
MSMARIINVSTTVLLFFACAVLAIAQVPRPSPELVINTLSGAPLRVTQYRGKVVIVEFLLTNCSHCQHTTDILKKLQGEYGPQRLQVLGSAVEEMAPMNLTGFVSRFKPGFPVGYNSLKVVAEYTQQNPTSRMEMPQLVFIDRTGIIRAQYAGSAPLFAANQEENIRRQIEVLLREASAGRPVFSGHYH